MSVALDTTHGGIYICESIRAISQTSDQMAQELVSEGDDDRPLAKSTDDPA